MKRFILLAAIALGLTACGPAPTSQSESRTFEVTKIAPPKHFTVDLNESLATLRLKRPGN